MAFGGGEGSLDDGGDGVALDAPPASSRAPMWLLLLGRLVAKRP